MSMARPRHFVIQPSPPLLLLFGSIFSSEQQQQHWAICIGLGRRDSTAAAQTEQPNAHHESKMRSSWLDRSIHCDVQPLLSCSSLCSRRGNRQQRPAKNQMTRTNKFLSAMWTTILLEDTHNHTDHQIIHNTQINRAIESNATAERYLHSRTAIYSALFFWARFDRPRRPPPAAYHK
jgi:hypothetical protein